jgi:hypothetical protein
LYSHGNNSPLKFKDPDGKDAIAVVFPDYKIATPIGKIGGLGHAGIVLIDNKTGQTRYYEYGRYDKEGRGETRRRSVPNVVMDSKTGRPTDASLKVLLQAVSKKGGHGGRVEGAYAKDDKFKEMVTYAEKRVQENKNPKREAYDLTDRNCGTFAKDVLEAGGHDTPWMIDPRPNSYIGELQSTFGRTSYDPKTQKMTVQIKEKEKK